MPVLKLLRLCVEVRKLPQKTNQLKSTMTVSTLIQLIFFLLRKNFCYLQHISGGGRGGGKVKQTQKTTPQQKRKTMPLQSLFYQTSTNLVFPLFYLCRIAETMSQRQKIQQNDVWSLLQSTNFLILDFLGKRSNAGVPIVAQQNEPTRIREDEGWIPGPIHWVRTWLCLEL